MAITEEIRVVNAFRHGVDGAQLQQATSNPNVQRVLQRQASLSKRLSTCSSINEEPARPPVTSPPIAAAPSPTPPPVPVLAPPPGPTIPPPAPVLAPNIPVATDEAKSSASHTETAV